MASILISGHLNTLDSLAVRPCWFLSSLLRQTCFSRGKHGYCFLEVITSHRQLPEYLENMTQWLCGLNSNDDLFSYFLSASHTSSLLAFWIALCVEYCDVQPRSPHSVTEARILSELWAFSADQCASVPHKSLTLTMGNCLIQACAFSVNVPFI